MLTTVLLLSLMADMPVKGGVAPDFTVKDIDGKELVLSKLVTQGPVILAFFPKAFTSGCTREMELFRDKRAEVEKAGGTVIGVSMDDVETLKKFRDSLKAPQRFVSDPDGKLLVATFDTKMPVLSMSKRYTFIIGEGRKVLDVQSGSDAVEAENAVRMCSLPARKAAPAPAPAP
jgi:peroxiredoxin